MTKYPRMTDNEAMKAAWEEFKTTKLFSALLAHMSPALMLENEGLLWGDILQRVYGGGQVWQRIITSLIHTQRNGCAI